MNWEEYKRECDRPDVLSRWLLEQSASVCDKAISIRLSGISESVPLEKPADHKGNPLLDMFRADLTESEVQSIASQVSEAFRNGVMTTGTVVRDYSGILRAWQEYERYFSDS